MTKNTLITLSVPNFDQQNGLNFSWENGFEIKVNLSDGSLIIEANTSGLISLANHLLNLAQHSVPSGYHIHLDEFNSLETGSAQLIIQKI